MGCFFLICIIVLIIYFACKNRDEESVASTASSTQKTTTPTACPQVNPNDPYEICLALACVATSIPYYKSDTYCLLHISIDSEKHETYIGATIGEYITDRSDTSQYRSLFIPDKISTLLSKVNFTDGNKGVWSITVNRCLSERRIKEAIQEGMSLVDGRPYTCNLKSYHPGNNPVQTVIDFDAAD